MTRKGKDRPARLDEKLFGTLSGLVGDRVPLVMVTVTVSTGSSPGKAGSKMIVTGDRLFGTVGGGKVEKAAIEHARTLLGRYREPDTVKYDVIRDLDMTCGGTMTMVYEPVTPPPRLVIFGAGHVSESLCAMATLAGFDVTVCDEREDWLTEGRFPNARHRILAPWEEAVTLAEIDEATFVTSVSPGHGFDLRVLGVLFEKNALPRYLGVIGSRRKQVTLKKELAESGVPIETLEKIHIPMGVNIGAVEPREIAVSIVAELVAQLRGIEEIQPW